MSRAGCYCGERFPAGQTCPYKCPEAADPRNLRAQKRRRKANDAAAKAQGTYLTPDEARAGERAAGTKPPNLRKFLFTCSR
jgi:hypothetical protein